MTGSRFRLALTAHEEEKVFAAHRYLMWVPSNRFHEGLPEAVADYRRSWQPAAAIVSRTSAPALQTGGSSIRGGKVPYSEFNLTVGKLPPILNGRS
jgi:hypothetical protein